ncbi:hypothetical protein [Alteromonas flava]|uniref:hypothetical protein n=1 Tax=Alteromonas flava TaxID=2048003 RepID=UPI000C2862C6|nr:hypothetical protein [Alteromonas flava]
MLVLLCVAAAFSFQAYSQSDEADELGLLAPSASAQESELGQDIESLQKALIELNRDLFILEEDLLFPSSTQIAIYLSMDVGQYFALDAVEVKIDDQSRSHYLYTQKQVEALMRGGVHQVYLGNVSQGSHQLTAIFHGIGPEQRPYKRGVTLDFTKSEDAQVIELKIVDSTMAQQPEFTAVALQ